MSAPLPGESRCAVLLVSLGADEAASLLDRLSSVEVGRIVQAARRLRGVSDEDVQRVAEDFLQSMQSRRILPGEGALLLQSALQKTGTSVPADEAQLELGLCPSLDADTLTQLLAHEHPQTVAAVLSAVDSPRGQSILLALPEEMRPEVVRRLAAMEAVSPDTLRRIELSLEQAAQRLGKRKSKKIKGFEIAAGLLKKAPKATAQQVIEEVAKQDTALAEKVKQNLLTFEDLANLDDRGMRNLLKGVDGQVLAKSLKGATEEIRARVFNNLSERAATMMSEDIESLPPMRLAEVEEARRAVLEVASTLLAEGKAIMVGGTDDTIV
jgi:flagellar motor switch protein FliG